MKIHMKTNVRLMMRKIMSQENIHNDYKSSTMYLPKLVAAVAPGVGYAADQPWAVAAAGKGGSVAVVAVAAGAAWVPAAVAAVAAVADASVAAGAAWVLAAAASVAAGAAWVSTAAVAGGGTVATVAAEVVPLPTAAAGLRETVMTGSLTAETLDCQQGRGKVTGGAWYILA